ncbi:MAG: hypothetical protein ABSE66_06255 [Thermoplasmata archaeon]|jgi:hypothetical protein
MNEANRVALLLEVQRLARKHGRAALLEAAESLESDESRNEMIKALRSIACLSPSRSAAARHGRERAVGVKKEVADDPQRSIEAWSRLIAGSERPEARPDRSSVHPKGRVTFDRGGHLIGTSIEIPKQWSGLIPLEVEIVGPGSKLKRRTVEIEAQELRKLVARRAALRDFPVADQG